MEEKNKKREFIIRLIILILLLLIAAAAVFVLIRTFVVTNLYQYDTASNLPAYKEGQSCSLYIYMCGSDLESRQGLAGENIDELLAADIPDNMNIVIETGGAKQWLSHDIANDKLQRYIVKDHTLTLVDELENASMGSGDTFTDFLQWSAKEYPADRSILVLWDHGSSSSGGVCFDENFGNDWLEYAELRDAFETADTGNKYDLVVFDACYMGSIEIAALVKDHAYYMVASQKIIPGDGMDYVTLASEFPKNDDETLGRLLLDAFYEKYTKDEEDSDIQLSLYKLANADRVIEAVNSAGTNMQLRQKTIDGSFKIFHAALDALVQNEGKNINVVDLQNFAEGVLKIDFLDHYNEIRLSIEAMVPYQVKSPDLSCNGISLYYPLDYNEKALQSYVETTPLKKHAELLESIYSDIPKDPIAFDNRGSINEDGDLEVSLTEESRPYIHTLYYKLWKESTVVPGTYTLVGTDAVGELSTALERQLDDLTFASGFDGRWYCLDGHPLLTDVTPRRLNSSFTAPVNVNGVDIQYNFVRPNMNSDIIETGFLGNILDEEGHANRNRRSLKEGDTVIVYHAANENGDKLSAGDAFTLAEDDGRVELLALDPGKYRLQMVALDIIGDEIASDYAVFEVTADGVSAKEIVPHR